MRVIFLTHNYPRHPGDLPGGFLHPLARQLRAAGADVRVVAPSDAGQAGRAVMDAIPVRRVRYAPMAWENLAYTGRMARALQDPRSLLALGGMVAALRRGARAEAAEARVPVVVHAHWWFPAGLAAPPELPLVITLHGTDGRLLDRSQLARHLGKRVLARAGVVTAVSRPLADIVERTTSTTIEPGDVQALPFDASGLTASTGGGGLVAVARLTTQKRLHLLIEAVALLARQGRALALTVIGGGEELTRLQALATELGIADRTRFTGQLLPAQVAAELGAADLFVLPARAEGYGLAAAEALIAGVPLVVCHDGGGLLEIAGSGSHSRVAEPSGAAIAAAIAGILDDPAARPAAAEAGAHLRARLDPASAARQALEWYRRAVERGR